MRIFTDLASGVLLSDVTDVDTVLPLNPGQGVLFPNPNASIGEYSVLHIEDTLGNIEIVKLVDRSGDSLVVERGFEGTTARAYTAGNARIELRGITASFANELFQRNEGDILDADNEIIVVSKRFTVSGQEPAALIEGELAVNIPDGKVWSGAVGSTPINILPPVLLVAGEASTFLASQISYTPTNDPSSSSTDVQAALEDHGGLIPGICQGGWYNSVTFDLTFNTTNWITFAGTPKTGHEGFINTSRSDDRIRILNQSGRQVLLRCHATVVFDIQAGNISVNTIGELRFYNVTKSRVIGGFYSAKIGRYSSTYQEDISLNWSTLGLVDSDDEIRLEVRAVRSDNVALNNFMRIPAANFWLEAVAI